MAASDSRPIPRKNTAFRAYFNILDADGDPVTGATSLDSEVSIDGAAFADCSAEATEIGSTGMYYLDLTAAEMNGDGVCVQVKTSSSGAKTTQLVFYPEEVGDIRCDTVQISGDSTAADNLELAADGTGYNLGGGSVVAASVTAPVTVTFAGQISSSVDDAAATTTSFIGAAGLNSSNDFYNGAVLAITSGTLQGIARRISDYTGSTRTFTFNTAFPAAPANGVTFIILGRIE